MVYGEHIMAQDLRFLSSNASFDPETVNLLSNALEGAWQRVQTSGNRLARPGYANVMREVERLQGHCNGPAIAT